jgi:protein-S-isoprenylcysteine O-methyltransferase Ste14
MGGTPTLLVPSILANVSLLQGFDCSIQVSQPPQSSILHHVPYSLVGPYIFFVFSFKILLIWFHHIQQETSIHFHIREQVSKVIYIVYIWSIKVMHPSYF